jgi:hypothetical protein
MSDASPEALYQSLFDHFGETASAVPSRRFGADALKVNGKIFASLTRGRRLLVKLPPDRVAALIASGVGEPFTTGPGPAKAAWVTLAPTSAPDWLVLAEEARAYVASLG